MDLFLAPSTSNPWPGLIWECVFYKAHRRHSALDEDALHGNIVDTYKDHEGDDAAHTGQRRMASPEKEIGGKRAGEKIPRCD